MSRVRQAHFVSSQKSSPMEKVDRNWMAALRSGKCPEREWQGALNA